MNEIVSPTSNVFDNNGDEVKVPRVNALFTVNVNVFDNVFAVPALSVIITFAT